MESDNSSVQRNREQLTDLDENSDQPALEQSQRAYQDIQNLLSEDAYDVPGRSKFTVAVLIACGIAALVTGLFKTNQHLEEPSMGISFLMVGLLVFIPGVYYFLQIMHIEKTRDPLAKLTALRDMPF